MPEVEGRWRADKQLLERTFPLARLVDEHPVRAWWERVDSVARFELHHLADDVRATQGAAGFGGLLAQLIQSPDTFDDYRYELRVAGAVARSGQRLLGLGGIAQGPDVTVCARSGHTVGIACYRPAGATPEIVRLQDSLRELCAALGLQMAQAVPTVRLTMEVVLPAFPAPASDIEEAATLLKDLWRRPDLGVLSGNRGVEVRRVPLPEVRPVQPRVRLRVLVPTPAREELRIEAHIREKLAREHKAWVRNFSGFPIFSFEQPPFSNGLSAEDIDALRNSTSHGFAGILSTSRFFPDCEGGLAHSMEDVCFHSRILDATPDTRFDLAIETYGDNLRSWGGDCYFSPVPAHAVEEWDAFISARRGTGIVCIQTTPLTLQRRYARVPWQGRDDPQLVPKIADALRRLMPERFDAEAPG